MPLDGLGATFNATLARGRLMVERRGPCVCARDAIVSQLGTSSLATCAECTAGVRELLAVAERLDLAGVAATRVAAALCFVPPQYSAWEGRLEVLDCKRRVETRVLDGARRLGDFAARDPAGACQRC